MATREQIYAAIRAADKAGDKVAVQRLGRHLQEMDTQPQEKPTSFWSGFGDELARGASNSMRFMERINPVTSTLKGVEQAYNALAQPKQPRRIPLLPGAVADERDRQAAAYRERRPTQGSMGGQIAGSVVASMPAMFIPGGPIAQGAAGGALLAEDLNDPLKTARDVAVGAFAGKAGQQLGKRVIAPVAERVGRTAPVRRAAEAVAKVTKRVPLPAPPRITRGERTLAAATKEGKPLRKAPNLAPIRQNVAEAADLNLPYSLADADPRLRTLGGSVARHSPDARTIAEQNYFPRARGQADRAVNAIDEYLAPVTDIRQRGDDIMTAGSREYSPLYEQAYANPPVSSPRLQQILDTPAGRQATGRANTIAANEFRDPRELGFVLDADGNVVIDPNVSLDVDEAGNVIFGQSPFRQPGYSTQSLDYVKRGMDDILEPYRNEISGRLELDEAGRAINGVKNSLLQEMDRVNPEYAQARAAYQRFARQKEALNTGHKVLPSGSVPQRNFDAIVGRADESTLPELRRGYATSMADTANRQRLSGNPYEAIYGSTDQQAKVGALFPEGAPRFGRQYDFEQQMQNTLNEVLRGSQTQGRNIADQGFKSGIGEMARDVAMDVASGGVPGVQTFAKAGLRTALGDKSRLGLLGAQKKADELAPLLFDTSDPRGILDYLDDLARRQQDEELRKLAYERAGGLLGIPAAGLALGSGR